MYANLQSIESEDVIAYDWNLPSQYSYQFSQKPKINSKIIHLRKEDLSKCFNQTEDECLVIFGVFS